MKKKLTFLSVVGARPNFMKVAPIDRAFRKYENVNHLILHTGQHYDKNMSKIFFEDLELPQPSEYLGIGSGTHAEQTAKVMIEFEKIIDKVKPDLVIVVGDVNSTVACTLVSVKKGIPVAHVEAGLRSFDRTMPEEINRIVTDSISDFLFVTEKSGIDNLKKEGIADNKIYFVGNVMIDSLKYHLEKSENSKIVSDLNLEKQKYILVTLHRPSNVDDENILKQIAKMFSDLPIGYKIVFPVHPRTKKMFEEYNLTNHLNLNDRIKLTEPIGYLDFLSLMKNAKMVITDSGGIQEETTYLQIPCITMRKNTERPITIEVGTNILCGNDFEMIKTEAEKIAGGKNKLGNIPELWDGNAANRIAEILYNKF